MTDTRRSRQFDQHAITRSFSPEMLDLAQTSSDADQLIDLLEESKSTALFWVIVKRQDLPAKVRSFIVRRFHLEVLADALMWENLTFDDATVVAVRMWMLPHSSTYAQRSKVQKVYYEAVANLVMVARGEGDPSVLDRIQVQFSEDKVAPSRSWKHDVHVHRHTEALVENSLTPMSVLTLPFMKVATTVCSEDGSSSDELIQKSGARWAAYMQRAGTPLTEEILVEALRSDTARLRMAIAGRSDIPEGLILDWLERTSKEDRLPVKVKNKIVSNRQASKAVVDAVADSIIREDIKSRSVSYLAALLVAHSNLSFENMIMLLPYNVDAVKHECGKNRVQFEGWLEAQHPQLVGFPEEWIWSALGAL